jgi:hypothetical protein
MAILAASKYRTRLKELKAVSEGWNPALCGIIRSGRGYNLIRRDIDQDTQEGIPDARLNEIDRAFAACVTTPLSSTSTARAATAPWQKIEKPKFTPSKLERFARRCDGFYFPDLIARSSIRPHTLCVWVMMYGEWRVAVLIKDVGGTAHEGARRLDWPEHQGTFFKALAEWEAIK